ncbi:MAG TPA: glycosyltransferase family 4 protein [Gemmatimonadaceae bacterium]|nr:glycosyltransferase family 4 protein [Gemmatimonadaceae bacterium]
MRIWLLKIGEAPAVLDKKLRPMRMTLLAEALQGRGHTVTWWMSTFTHGASTFTASSETPLTSSSGVRVHLLPSRGYKRHLSLARVIEHRRTAAQFSQRALAEEQPDIILSALPTIELCSAAAAYARATNVPLVIDVRDWWPDALALSMPRLIRPIVRAAVFPLQRQVSQAFRTAAAVTGITDEFVDWGVAKSGRKRGALDRAFPFGYPEEVMGEVDRATATSFWKEKGLTLSTKEPIIAFAGTFGRAHDIPVVLRAAELLEQRGSPARFVLCGSGERLQDYRSRAASMKNVLLPGWVSRAQLHALLERAAVAVNCVPLRDDYLNSINNKPAEYLRFGLPLVVSPGESVLGRLVEESACGLTVPHGQADKLADALEEIINTDQLRSEMMRQSRALYERQFQAGTVYRGMAMHLEQVVGASK